MENYNKQRLFEVMQKVDPTFKPKLNEGFNSQEFQQKINNGDVWEEYYAPSDSEEYTDGQNFYNRSGQQLRNPKEYARGGSHEDGYTPFGDEG